MSHMASMRREGLLSECHTWRDLQNWRRKEYLAHCTTVGCQEPKQADSRPKGRLLHQPSFTATDCPSCKCVLKWSVRVEVRKQDDGG